MPTRQTGDGMGWDGMGGMDEHSVRYGSFELIV